MKVLQSLLVFALLCQSLFAAEFETEYAEGDTISPAIFVENMDGSHVQLASLLQAESGINVLFIFGGGDLGSGMPGHLMCVN